MNDTTTKTNLAALAMGSVRNGWAIFPLRPGAKIPLVRKADGGRGVYDGTHDPGTVAAWWERWPDANIGVSCGPGPEWSGCWVLDVDAHHGGNLTLAALVTAHGPLPKTRVVRTASGGQHWFFRWPKLEDGRTLRNAVGVRGRDGDRLAGLDVRAQGGFVVGAGSVAESKVTGSATAYTVETDAPMADAPEWLLALVAPMPIRAVPPPAHAPRPAVDGDQFFRRRVAWCRASLDTCCRNLATLAEGGRNDATNRALMAFAGYAAAGYLAEDEVKDAIRAAAEASGLSSREVDLIFRGGGAWDKGFDTPRHPELEERWSGPAEPPRGWADVPPPTDEDGPGWNAGEGERWDEEMPTDEDEEPTKDASSDPFGPVRTMLREVYTLIGRDDTSREERQQAARTLAESTDALAALAFAHPGEWESMRAALATGTGFAEHAQRVAVAVRKLVEERKKADVAARRASARPAAERGPKAEGGFLVRADPTVMVRLDRRVRMVDGVPEPGDPKPTLSNAVLILAEDVGCRDRVRFNAFTQLVEIDGMEKTDDLDTHVAIALDRVYGLVLPTDRVREALSYVARKNAYDPLVEYLDGLRWDRVQRIGTIFRDYFAVAAPVTIGADGEAIEDGALAAAIERCFFVGAVARAFKPGCKLDTMPIFVGLGGKGKSRALAALCPRPEWFSDTPIDLRDKDRFQALDGIWIYEQAELDTLSTSSLNRAKGFMSSAFDRYRRPYDRSPQRHARRTAMCGSTNEREFGKDRRFHPLDVRDDGTMDPEGVAALRDQIWAEAVEMFRAGVTWNLDIAEHARLMDHAEKYRIVVPWEAQVDTFLTREAKAYADGTGLPHFDIGQVTTFLQLPADKASSNAIMQKVGAILTDAGCRKGRPRMGDKRPSRWFLPGVDPATA